MPWTLIFKLLPEKNYFLHKFKYGDIPICTYWQFVLYNSNIHVKKDSRKIPFTYTAHDDVPVTSKYDALPSFAATRTPALLHTHNHQSVD